MSSNACHRPPSAVRFGRIPKREKQRMLLEMQNAMNNMMSNNSQLHSMLHGHQSPPLPMEALPSNASPSPSSSPASASPSCSNPSSPHCPQDSESVVSMDTNSSSASSCASDCGEDEAVVTMSRQHRDAFAYGQQRSLRQGQGSPSPVMVALETGSESHMEEQQETWNCWNNVVITGHRDSPYSNSISNAAYREESAGYQQQQLNSTPSCEPPEDSQRQQELTHSSYNGPTNCVDNRAHLVSERMSWIKSEHVAASQSSHQYPAIVCPP